MAPPHTTAAPSHSTTPPSSGAPSSTAPPDVALLIAQMESRLLTQLTAKIDVLESRLPPVSTQGGETVFTTRPPPAPPFSNGVSSTVGFCSATVSSTPFVPPGFTPIHSHSSSAGFSWVDPTPQATLPYQTHSSLQPFSTGYSPYTSQQLSTGSGPFGSSQHRDSSHRHMGFLDHDSPRTADRFSRLQTIDPASCWGPPGSRTPGGGSYSESHTPRVRVDPPPFRR